MTKISTMQHTYFWTGKDSEGLLVQGETTATTLENAKNDLIQRGIIVTKIRKKPKPLIILNHQIKPVEIAFFFRQMATMLKAGMPVTQALDMLIESSDHHKKMKLMLLDLRQVVSSGSYLSEGLEKYPTYFDALSVSLVKAGEASGLLDHMLSRIAIYKEKHETLKKKVKKALYYPLAVFITAIVVTSIMLIYVVPTFSDLFKSFGATLPVFTQLVIKLSTVTQKYWYLIVLILLISIILFGQLRRKSFKFRYKSDQMMLKLPLIGSILKTASVARFARTLSTVFSSGMPVVDSLPIVAKATGNLVYEHATLRIRTLIMHGATLSQAIKDVYVFPSFIVQMSAVGESAGDLDQMLAKVALTYEEDVDHAVDGLSSLIEPIIMVVLGGIIGALVVAMYLPIFQLGSIM